MDHVACLIALHRARCRETLRILSVSGLSGSNYLQVVAIKLE